MNIPRRVAGTQDYTDTRTYTYLIDALKKHMSRYAIEEIMTPIIESAALFTRALGTHTDVVSKEMFYIKPHENHTADDLICLRPEATASTTRLFLEQSSLLNTPWRVYSYGPMFRYERPQKGRLRQFHQFNIEYVQAKSVAYDAELICMLDRFFQETMDFHAYALRINYLGCASDRITYRSRLREFLASEPVAPHICATCTVRAEKNCMRVFDCKQASCQELYVNAPRITEHLCATCATDWQSLQTLLGVLSISYSIDHALVRGLDYYYGTVFEFSSMLLGAQNAFCGGGRYELATSLGASTPVPSVGAAIGLERLLLLLEATAQQAVALAKKPLHMIIPMDESLIPLALLIADMLRAHDLSTSVLCDATSLKKGMQKASAQGATYVLIIGSQEQATNQVTVKNMQTGVQKSVSQSELVAYLQS